VEGFVLFPGEVFGGVVPVCGFATFNVEADVCGFVAVGAYFPADKADVVVDALFYYSVEVEGEWGGMAVFQEFGEGFSGGVADAGYGAAEDFYAVGSDGDGHDREDVADEGVEGDFFPLFPDGFHAVGD